MAVLDLLHIIMVHFNEVTSLVRFYGDWQRFSMQFSHLVKLPFEACSFQGADFAPALKINKTNDTNVHVLVLCAPPCSISVQSAKLHKNKARYLCWILKEDL